MINRIIDFSVNNRFIIFFFVATAVIAGWWSMRNVGLDAIPDLGDTQVIIYSRWDRSPDIMEDQVTYPIVTAMLGAPRVKTVRDSPISATPSSTSSSRTARTSTGPVAHAGIPLGRAAGAARGRPDRTGPRRHGPRVGLPVRAGGHIGERSLADLRTLQDWYLRYHLKSVAGVAEVAPLGGFVKQYQVNLDPIRLQAYGITINRVVDAVRGSNIEVGGRLIEFGGTEYTIRGRGYAQSIQDFENIVLKASESGTPIRVKDVGHVTTGPDIRRGVSDLDGQGEAVSGIVVMRHGQNALEVIDRVKAKIREIEPGLPKGVRIVPIYDRSELIHRSVDTLKETLFEVILTVVFIILLFLWHVPSALIPVITLPIAVLLSFIPSG